MGKFVAVLCVVVAVFVVLCLFWPIGADYYYTYHPIARAWTAGETHLYDQASRGFFNAPWLILPLALLSNLPINIGEAALNTCTMLVAVFAARVFSNKTVAIALSSATLTTFSVLIVGQIDGIILLGVILSWVGVERENEWLVGVALPVLLIKPTGILLILLFCARWIFARHAWRATVPTIAAIIMSMVIFGLDWPIRYLKNYAEFPPYIRPQTTIWRALNTSQMFIVCGMAFLIFVIWWRMGYTRKAFLFGLCAGLFFAPYALTAHYILLIPALATLSDKNILIGAIVYPTTLIPLLRLRFGFNVAPLDAIYPLALLILLWFVLKNETVYNDGNYGRTAKTIPYPKNL